MVEFFVPGLPAPGGSKRAYVVAGRAVVTDDCKMSKPWKAVVALAAERAMGGDPPLDGPLLLTLTFVLPRPKGHYRAGKHSGELRRCAPRYPAGKPDLTKLIRSCEDACTRIVWRDDAQVVGQAARKVYGDAPGVRVAVAAAGEGS